MAKLIAGLDEIATETQKSEGWCYFCIPEPEYLNFSKEVEELLKSTTKVKSFHAKKFVTDQANEYEQFLRIIRKYAENSAPTLLCCTLQSENWKHEFLGFCNRITRNVFNQVGVTNQELIEVCSQLTPGLFSFIRLIDHLGNANQLVIDVDSDNVKEKYPDLNTIIKGHSFTADYLMPLLYNAYRKYQFPQSPELLPDGISVLKDAASYAIQAADVIGNFSTSYIYYRLGNTSKKRQLKGVIFEKVFGDRFAHEDVAGSIKLVGQNDLELLEEGAYTMEFTAYLT